MPVYRIDIPGQGTFRVESPVELDDAQAYQAVVQQMPGLGAPPGGTKNPLMGALGRAAGLTASGVEAVAEVAERAGDFMESKIPLSNIPPEQIKSEKQLQPLFNLAGSLRDVEKNIGYSPSTKLSDLADNPLNAVPFIAERVITSTPDMAAAVYAFIPYIGARTKEILDERVKNDNKTLNDATVGDVTAAAGAAITEATLERFATKRLGKGAEAQSRTGRLARETGVQGGTEAVEEGAAYLGETAGTIKGVDPKELGERMLEGAIVGGGLGGGVQATREVLSGRKETPAPEKEEDLKQQAVESAPERLSREQAIEATEPGMAPEEEALKALGLMPEPKAAEAVPGLSETQRQMAEAAAELEAPPEIPTETRPYISEELPPEPEEIAGLKAEKAAAEKDISRAMRDKGPSLATVLRNRLSESEVFDISPEPGVAKVFRMSPKRGEGENIADVLANTNQLDDFLDPELKAPGRETEAVEYIKDKIRNQNYLTFETDIRLQKLNMDLAQIEEALARELTDEQIRQKANEIAAEIAAEEGPRVAETAPEIVTTGGITERITPEGEPEQVAAVRSLRDMLENPEQFQTDDDRKVSWTALPNGFSYRQYVMEGIGPRQEIKSPTGAIIARGLDSTGKLYQEQEAYGTLDDVLSGRSFKEFEQYFKAKPGIEFKQVVPSGKKDKNIISSDLPDGMKVNVFKTSDGYGAGLYDADAEQYVNGSIRRYKGDKALEGATAYANKLREQATAVERPELELKSETAEETVARQEREAAELEKRELKKIADNERDLFKLEQQSNPVTPPVQQSLFDVTVATPAPMLEANEVTPSFTREFDRLSKSLDKGVITPNEFAAGVQAARAVTLAAKASKPIRDRVRGMDFIIERLRNGLRNGALTEETVELTEWFMKQNPALVQDLGISIRNSEETGTSGQYMPTPRIVKLIVGSTKTDTAVHEILHHLERMMPEKVRSAIVKSWAAQYGAAKKSAKGDENLTTYFDLLDEHHKTGSAAPFNLATKMIQDGKVDYQYYQFANPSEFWAVNASGIVQGRYDVRGDRLGALKRWLSELVQKLKSALGMKSDAPIIRALDSLSKSDGKFVSTEMLAGTGIYPNVRTNIFGQKPVKPSWGRPDDRKTDDVIYRLQDKMVDTKRVIANIEEARGKLQDRWNAYLQEELYHGRTAKQTNDFIQKELTPLLKEINAKKFTIADVEEYLHNRHAEERNIQVAKVNPAMPDGGSGIFTDDANKYLDALPPQKRKDLESIAKKVDAITAKTRQTLIQNGIEDPATIQAWENSYKNYIPLAREEMDYEVSNIGRGIGQGFSVRGPTSKRAAGSSRQVVDILANIAMQRERAIVRSEKNRVSQAIYGLAVQHPNTDFWFAVDPKAIKDPLKTAQQLQSMGINPADAANIMKEPTRSYVDPTTNSVIHGINPTLRGAENVVSVRVNGEDKFVFFNTKDPRAIRMATALKNLDADQLSQALEFLGVVTRYFARVNTQYNPIFGAINFLRDYQGAALNLTNTPIKGKTKQVMADTLPALRGIYADLRARRDGKATPSGKWSSLWDEFQKEGGQTGFRDQFSRADERRDALTSELKKLSEGKAKKSARVIFDWLSDYNETMENAVRLAAYKAALDQGLSKQQAASVAKNLTVNFNRKGQVARQVGALYAFFNASVQGTARMYQTLRGPAGKKILAGGLILGFAQAMLLDAAGFDEDEPPDFIKDRNIVIPTGDGKYITIPMPLGFNIIPTVSRVSTEWALNDFRDPGKRVAQITSAVLDMFNPLGNAGWSWQTFAPTPFDPVVALIENKDWTGKTIAKKDISSLDPTPGYTRAKDTASWVSKKLSEFFNYASGGTEFRPGKFSPTPDQIDYLIGQAFGGIGREAIKAQQTAAAAVTGEELPTYKIPLVGRFVGETKSQAAQSAKFYENIKLINEHENEIKGRRKNREPVDEYIRENPEARLYGAANNVERTVQALRRRKSEMIKKDAPKEDIKAIDKRITDIMTRFNERVGQAKESGNR
jgi:hypothetical protein